MTMRIAKFSNCRNLALLIVAVACLFLAAGIYGAVRAERAMFGTPHVEFDANSAE